ncbi:MAG: ATP-binding protein [Opitutales bacterium]|nr:ATP-binding protein [Opitutales bacterium]
MPAFRGSSPAWAIQYAPEAEFPPGTVEAITEVLVIESNEPNFQHLRHLLPPTHSCDFEFHWTQSLDKARRMIEQRPWDLVFFDLNMAAEEHTEPVLKEIEEISAKLPLIILTDMAHERLARDAIRRGAQDYMIKGEDTAAALHRSIWAAMDRFNLTRDLKGKTQALEQAFWQKHQFLNTLTHEIKTPMNGIRGGVQLLREDCMGQEQLDSLDLIDVAIGNLMSLIDNLLEHGKAEAGQLELRREPVSIFDITDPVMGTFTMACEVKGIRLEWDIKDPMPETVNVDRVRLHQVISNLVGNAVKFTRIGEIRLSCYHDDIANTLHFSVSDSGCGISEDDQKTIFQPYNQGHDCDLSQAAKGTGLGLAICREYVKLMGGEISVHSEVGQGATFAFYLPVG